jgi:hypothetical protein
MLVDLADEIGLFAFWGVFQISIPICKLPIATKKFK